MMLLTTSRENPYSSPGSLQTWFATPEPQVSKLAHRHIGSGSQQSSLAKKWQPGASAHPCPTRWLQTGSQRYKSTRCRVNSPGAVADVTADSFQQHPSVSRSLGQQQGGRAGSPWLQGCCLPPALLASAGIIAS